MLASMNFLLWKFSVCNFVWHSHDEEASLKKLKNAIEFDVKSQEYGKMSIQIWPIWLYGCAYGLISIWIRKIPINLYCAQNAWHCVYAIHCVWMRTGAMVRAYYFEHARSAHGNINRWINKFNSTLVYHRLQILLLLRILLNAAIARVCMYVSPLQ